jgi:hypothetical protein
MAKKKPTELEALLMREAQAIARKALKATARGRSPDPERLEAIEAAIDAIAEWDAADAASAIKAGVIAWVNDEARRIREGREDG